MDRVAELMSSDPVVVSPDTPASTCAQRMFQHDIRHLPVVAEGGRLVGLVTDTAVFRTGAFAGANQELWVPAAGATNPVLADELKVPVEVCLSPRLATATGLRRLVDATQDFAAVVDDDHVVGVITEHDGIRAAAEVLQDFGLLTVSVESSAPVQIADRSERGRVVMDRMERLGIRHVVIVQDGALFGVVAYGDLLADRVVEHPDRLIGEVVRTRRVHTTTADATMAQAAATMMEHHIGCLPVLDGEGRPVQVITRTDLIEAAVIALEEREAFPAAS